MDESFKHYMLVNGKQLAAPIEMMVYTRALVCRQQRCLPLIPSLLSVRFPSQLICCELMQQTSLRHHDGVSTNSSRSFATNKKRKHNKKGGNTQHDAYKQQIKSQQPSSSIIGMRPGQTSFSPPIDKTLISQSPIAKSPIQSTPMTSNKSKHAQSNTVVTTTTTSKCH